MEGQFQIFSGNSNLALANEICQNLNVPLGRALVGRFKNGETRVRIEENVRGSDVFLIQSICAPVNHHLMELLLMIDALRRASARRITAVMPYYGYAKQEKKTAGREPISAKLVSNLITTAGVNRVLTLDLHAAAIEGFFDIPVDHLRAAPILAERFKQMNPADMVVVSPDTGGVNRANDFRERLGASLAIIAKQRPQPDVSEILEMVGEVKDKTAVIVDDMISTGGTLIEAADLLMERGAKEVYACATHAILAGNSAELIRNSVVKKVVVTNTIPVSAEQCNEKIEVLTVAPLLAEAIQRIHKDLSLSTLFV
ncbi:MAG: ribose-phosphate pyrophosphokinase [Chloroflexota bacterium]